MIIDSFNIKVEINKILNLIECYPENDLYMHSINLFSEIEKDFYNNIKPRGRFILKKDIPCYFNNAIFVLYTIGEEINIFISDLFNKGDYLKGVIANAMADNYLIQMDKVFCENITNFYLKDHFKFTQKLIPAENIDIKYQKDICSNLNSDELLNISINESYVLNPLKSSSFIVGADKDLQYKTISHNCSKCNLKECRWRENL